MEYDVEKISNNIKKQKKIKKTLKYIILNILIIFFIINLILLFEENTHICGIYCFNIISESMEPTLNVNDVVIVKKTNIANLQKGDIITFNQDGRIISHRIKKIIKDDNYLIVTQGDNNEVEDKDVVKEEQIYGKVIFKIGKIGKIISYIQNMRIFINIIIFIVIIYILMNLRDNQKNERKIKRKKYEIKKIRDNYYQ